MQKKKSPFHDFIDETYTSFRKGIDIQREIYKAAMHEKDYDTAVTALDNIKIEIMKGVIAKDNKQKIIRINNILNWYRILPYKYTRRTEYGSDTVYPFALELKIIKNLNITYGIITEQLSNLGLL